MILVGRKIESLKKLLKKYTTHIKDKSRLKSPGHVAEEIKKQDDGRLEIYSQVNGGEIYD